jgi:hypothetical protein
MTMNETRLEVSRDIDRRVSNFTFANLHGVPTNERNLVLAALAGYLARELTQDEAIDLTSRLHRYY